MNKLKEQLDEELAYRDECIDKIARYKKAIRTMKAVKTSDSLAEMNVSNMQYIYKVNKSNWQERLSLTITRIYILRMAIHYRNR